jgi:hypothetical protein
MGVTMGPAALSSSSPSPSDEPLSAVAAGPSVAVAVKSPTLLVMSPTFDVTSPALDVTSPTSEVTPLMASVSGAPTSDSADERSWRSLSLQSVQASVERLEMSGGGRTSAMHRDRKRDGPSRGHDERGW